MAGTEWIAAIDKRPADRDRRDADVIATRLRRVQALARLPANVLDQLALVAYYEDLEKGVTLFRQGDQGSSWYAVLGGSVEVRFFDTESKGSVSLGTLGVGATFGESILNTCPRDSTVLTRSTCELLRVEKRDFRHIWEKNKELMNDLVSRNKVRNGYDNSTPVATPSTPPPSSHRAMSPDFPDPARPIVDSPSPGAAHAAWALRAILLGGPSAAAGAAAAVAAATSSSSSPHPAPGIGNLGAPGGGGFGAGSATAVAAAAAAGPILRDRRGMRNVASGAALVDWLMAVSAGTVRKREQAAAMWQVLVEEGVLFHVSQELPFVDHKGALYRFWTDLPPGSACSANSVTTPGSPAGSISPTEADIAKAENSLPDTLTLLAQHAPNAYLRMILRKPPEERTQDDQETIFEETLHIKALSHLSNSVKRELAAVIVFEAHTKKGTILFQQGDEGRSWYIILRGSVEVVIHGKGTVTTLQEGDDFGKLALINDAPRAATIVLRENICHFLRVDKEDFNRILRDVEANTVRLKEHGKDVLILEKVSNRQSHFKYTVMSGTPQKMLEHLLETRVDAHCTRAGSSAPGGGSGSLGRDDMRTSDPFLEDFLLSHIVFMPTQQLVKELTRHYRMSSASQEQEFVFACKRRVVQFVYCWVSIIRHPVFDDPCSLRFLEDLAGEVESDCMRWAELEEEASLMHHVMSQLRRYQEDRKAAAGQKWTLPSNGQPVSLFSPIGTTRGRAVIRPTDDIIFRVYCADHTYCTLRCAVAASAEKIKEAAAEKLKMRPGEDLVLVEVKSNGDRVIVRDDDLSVPTSLSLNGRIFVSPRDHLDALTPLPEQEEPTDGMNADLELLSARELAYHMTLFDWDLFWSVHEYELLYQTFGRHKFGQITANLDVFLRRFNEIQFWVVTEMCLTSAVSKRVQILRKMIKLAYYCKEYRNLNALFAIVMGLSNVAVSRLSLTWEKLPSKLRKTFTDMEALIDPTRNHRAYRLAVGKMQPPVIPFMPLLLKDMTFTDEGNKTIIDGLVNFEKMHLLAQTMRSVRHCRSRHLVLDPPSPKSEADVREYASALRTIDNQKRLMSLSLILEPRRS